MSTVVPRTTQLAEVIDSPSPFTINFSRTGRGQTIWVSVDCGGFALCSLARKWYGGGVVRLLALCALVRVHLRGVFHGSNGLRQRCEC